MTSDDLFAKGEELYELNEFEEAVKYYRQAAEMGHDGAQHMLGNCYYFGKGVSKDYKNAIKWYRKAAKQDNPCSQFSIGLRYYFGEGMSQDYTSAFKWFDKASDNGFSLAIHFLGLCFYNGYGVEQDYSKAFGLYKKAAEQGIAEAQNMLGMCYLDGRGVEQNTALAVEWFLKASAQGDKNASANIEYCLDNEELDFDTLLTIAESGNAKAQNKLGVRYSKAIGVEKDYEKAVEWCKKSAEQGYMYAQNNLGFFYKNGLGVEKDTDKAVELYALSAEQGYDDAEYNLAECYYYGDGVKQDYSKAFGLYKKAAEQGIAEAQNMLAICYLDGRGIERNTALAVEWLLKASAQGDETVSKNIEYCLDNEELDFDTLLKIAGSGNANAQNMVGVRYFRAIGVEKDYEKAVEWCKKSAEQGYMYAQNNLGFFYKNGLGVEKDTDKAVELYALSAEQGYDYAEYNLAECYYSGDGVKQDYSKAFELYKKAAEQGRMAEAQNMLGMCYAYGRGTDKNTDEALNWFKKAAEQGYETAKDNVKALLNDVDNYDEDSIDELTRSAANGNSDAMYRLGLIYNNGINTDIDYDEALKWFIRAGKNGNPFAQLMAGVYYDSGRVEGYDDSDEAAEWYRKAAEQGIASAQNALGFYYMYDDEEEAFSWFKKAAENGNTVAKWALGFCYNNGFGVETDYIAANEYLSEVIESGELDELDFEFCSCFDDDTGIDYEFDEFYENAVASCENDKENPFSISNMAIFHEHGIGVEKDYDRAVELYGKAASLGNKYAIGRIAGLKSDVKRFTPSDMPKSKKMMMSIKPQYVKQILSGEKTCEMRTVRCKQDVDRVLIYSSYPVKKVVGETELVEIIQGSAKAVWEEVKGCTGTTREEFLDAYADGRDAVVYRFGTVTVFDPPKALSDFGRTSAPQSYCYIDC